MKNILISLLVLPCCHLCALNLHYKNSAYEGVGLETKKIEHGSLSSGSFLSLGSLTLTDSEGSSSTSDLDINFLVKHGDSSYKSIDILRFYYDSTTGVGISGEAHRNGFPGHNPQSYCYDIGYALLSYDLDGIYSISTDTQFQMSTVHDNVFIDGNSGGGVSFAIKINNSNQWYVGSDNLVNSSAKGPMVYSFGDGDSSLSWYKLDTTTLEIDYLETYELDFSTDFVSEVGIYYSIYGFRNGFPDKSTSLEGKFDGKFHFGIDDFSFTNLKAVP